jgi:hypothetical protein
MSSSRPPLPTRILVLLAAIAALFLAVCAHARPPAPAAGPPDAGAASDRELFMPTKAPQQLYRP